MVGLAPVEISAGPIDQHAIEITSTGALSVRSEREKRQEKMQAVVSGAAKTVAPRLSRRDRLRRFLNGIAWQLVILAAALVDICMLLVESGSDAGSS